MIDVLSTLTMVFLFIVLPIGILGVFQASYPPSWHHRDRPFPTRNTISIGNRPDGVIRKDGKWYDTKTGEYLVSISLAELMENKDE